MKRFHFLALAGALLLALAACTPKDAQPQTPAERQIITVQDAKGLLDAGAELTLVDVRTAQEYEEGHIPSAVNIPNEEIQAMTEPMDDNLDGTIIVYCRSGRRSREAAEKLAALGYRDVRDLGGLGDWPFDTIPGTEPGTWVMGESDPTGILSSFTTESLEGSLVDETVLTEAKLTMVNVWATYCGPCLQEMPALGELAAEYKEKGVQIIGLVTDVLNSDASLNEKQMNLARDAVASTGADYLHMVPSESLFGILRQITSVPTTFFVDENGNQVDTAYLGARDKASWAAIIDGALAEVEK